MAARTGDTNPQDSWYPARLIPVAGIRGQEEQERRATSALLAVMRAVPDFGHALLADLSAPKGRISTFAEVQLKDGDGRVHIPDGAVVVERGKTSWRALVEVKTGSAALQTDQVSRYLDMAREHEFDAVVTISNQITARPADSPLTVDKRKLKRVGFFTFRGGESSPRLSYSTGSAVCRIPIRPGFSASSSPISTMRTPGRAVSRTWVRAGSASAMVPDREPFVQPTRKCSRSPSAGSSSSTISHWDSLKISGGKSNPCDRVSSRSRSASKHSFKSLRRPAA